MQLSFPIEHLNKCSIARTCCFPKMNLNGMVMVQNVCTTRVLRGATLDLGTALTKKKHVKTEGSQMSL